MIDNTLPETTNSRSSAAPADFPAPPSTARRLERIQFCLCLTVTVGMLIYLLWTPGAKRASADAETSSVSQENLVRLTPSGNIHIQPDSPLYQKLGITTVKPEKITMPVLTVTGTVIASLRPTKGRGRYWQFSSPELLTTYTDWQKAIADIAFAEKQIHSIRQLADNRVRAQDTLVARLKKLVEAGTDTEKNLAAAQTELLQAQIQGRKDIHEAETMLRVAQQSEAALSRQLQQAGVDPSLLRVTATEMDIVVADVPEGLVSRVRLGQKCEAKFSCLAGKQFSGNVRVISPVLSKERRSLRVLFVIDDPDDLLRPGMFADIGLGTDERESIQVPLAGVVHVDRADYLLVRAPDGDWQVTAVEVGEANQGSVEILDGIRSGSQIVAQGAILLKPLIVETMQRPRSRETGSK